MRPRSASHVTFAGLVAAMLSLALFHADAQNPRLNAQFGGLTVHQQFAQGAACPGDLEDLNILVVNSPSVASQVVTYTAFAEPVGILGFSWSPEGPFTDTLEVKVPVDATGNGESPFFWIRAMTSGTVRLTACSSALGCVSNPADLRVAGIDSVQLIPLDSPLDENPNPGGGKRIYPGKMNANDDIDRRAITVRAIIGEPIAGVPVYFAGFDVDDPSTDAKPVDANGPAGNDNRGQPGSFSETVAFTNPAGIAETTFRVGMQPGDNYRVAASCRGDYLSTVTVEGFDLIDAEGQALPSEVADVSEMVTVWRKLHVEVDSMGLVADNSVRGIVLGTGKKKGKASSTTEVKLDIDGKLDRERFRGGLLKISGVSSYYVVENDADSVTVDGVLDNATIAGKPFVLVDDDDHNNDDGILRLDGDEGEDVARPDLSAMSDGIDDGICNGSGLNPFGAAYVCPVVDVGDDNDHVPFLANSPRPPAVIATYDFDAIGTEQDPLFWTVYVLGAYQPESERDADPGMERFTNGRVDDINGIGASIFMETIADGERTRGLFVLGCSIALTVVHEIGHLLNGQHPHGGLMASPCDSSTIVLAAKTIVAIRNLIHP